MDPKREAYENRKAKTRCACFTHEDGLTFPKHGVTYRLCAYCMKKIHVDNFGTKRLQYWHTKFPASVNGVWTYGLCPRNENLEIHEPMDVFAQKAYERLTKRPNQG